MTTEHRTDTHNPSRRRITTAAKVILTAGAIALGAMSLTPTMANADTNNNPKRTEAAIKQDCKDGGGDYYQGADTAGNTSHCSYFDTDGNLWIDNYKNGQFTGTSGPFRPKPPVTPPPAGTAVLHHGVNQVL
jgi:hypothetical protein